MTSRDEAVRAVSEAAHVLGFTQIGPETHQIGQRVVTALEKLGLVKFDASR